VKTLTVTDDAGVRVVTMNRPDSLNALNSVMVDELTEAFLAAGDAPTVRVVVLTGAGRAFSAGADLSEGPDATRARRHGLHDMVTAMIDFPKPFLAAVNGLGVGYGATVCGLADIVSMAESARLRAPFSALGLTAELASTYTFFHQLGHQRAAWFLLSSEWMSAAECLEAGLAIEVVGDDDLMATVLARAATLAALPVASLITTKTLLRRPHADAMKAAMAAENDALAELGGGPANAEAITAFLQKRDPDFTNL
jgi:enoyl-CoA hydratase/carnithine racemase